MNPPRRPHPMPPGGPPPPAKPPDIPSPHVDESNPGVDTMMESLKPEEGGDVVGRYKLLQQIGEGGFGTVWLAEQTEPVRRRVALKIIKPGMDSKEVIARFEQERQALAMMDHPNIARVLDGGMTGKGRPFFVMELVRGIKITDYCDQAKLSTAERLELFVSICNAVQHAHQKGIIHRDLKPSNILVALHDGIPVPKVIDFGVAKATQGSSLTEKTLFTQFEQMVGTPLYMSPEQAEMSGLDVDTRSDIYSLGVLLYELLTGRTPFDPDKFLRQGHDEMRRVIREEEPPRPSLVVDRLAAEQKLKTAELRQSDTVKLIGQIRGDLDWIVMKSLEKDRSRRYETANGLAMDIKRHLAHEPVLARPPSQLYRFNRLIRRNKLVFTAIASVALALIAGLTFSVWSFRREQRQRQIAEFERHEAETQRAAVEVQRQLARDNALSALASENHARRLLYAADMNLAQQSLEGNNIGRARKLLDRHRPQSGDKDLRGWEWRWLWQQCRGDAITLTKGPDRAYSLSISADGRRLAVGYFNGDLEIWDIPGNSRIKAFPHSPFGVRVAFSLQGQKLYFNSENLTLKVFDLDTAEESVLTQLPGSARDISLSADGQLLVITCRQSTTQGADTQNAVAVFELSTNKILHSIPFSRQGHSFFNNARISNDHQRLYVTSAAFVSPKLQCIRLADRSVIWEADAREGLQQASVTGFTAMDLSPDGRVLATATGYNNNTIVVWNAETGQQMGILHGHKSYVMELKFSPDGLLLASSSSDETVHLWDTKSWNEAFAPFRGNADEVHSVAFSPDSATLATGSKNGEVMLWSQRNRRPPNGRSKLPADIEFARFLPGGKAILAVGPSRKLSIFSVDTLEQVFPNVPLKKGALAPPNFWGFDDNGRFHIHKISDSGSTEIASLPLELGRTPHFAYAPSKRLLARMKNPATIQVSNIDNLRETFELSSQGEELVLVRFTDDARYLLSTNSEGVARLWDIQTKTRLPEAEQFICPRGIRLFGKYRNGLTSPALLSWIGAAVEQAGATPKSAGSDYPRSLTGFTDHVLSSDGRTFALTTEHGVVELWDGRDRKLISRIHTQQHAVFSGAFSPDNTRLAIADDVLWDTVTGQELITLKADGALLWLTSFSDDGNVIMVGSPEQPGHFQLWQAPSLAEIEETERVNGRWRHKPEQ